MFQTLRLSKIRLCLNLFNDTFSTVGLVCLFLGRLPPSGPWPPRSRGFYITHNDAKQSVALLWTSDHLVAKTSTRQHTTLTTDQHPCPRWDWNPQSQQVRGRRSTMQTARTLRPAFV